jgi:hypothetical protein
MQGTSQRSPHGRRRRYRHLDPVDALHEQGASRSSAASVRVCTPLMHACDDRRRVWVRAATCVLPCPPSPFPAASETSAECSSHVSSTHTRIHAYTHTRIRHTGLDALRQRAYVIGVRPPVVDMSLYALATPCGLLARLPTRMSCVQTTRRTATIAVARSPTTAMAARPTLQARSWLRGTPALQAPRARAARHQRGTRVGHATPHPSRPTTPTDAVRGARRRA